MDETSLEDILMELVRTALRDQAVAVQDAENGLQFLAYPTGEGVLVGVGFDRYLAHRVQMEEVLRKRSDNLKVFSEWQPALLADGSFYVVRRIADVTPDVPFAVLSSDEISEAKELLL